MKSMALAALLITAGLAQAKDPDMNVEEVQEVDDLQVDATGVSESDAPTLSRKKRGVAPVVGLPCESGHKLVGEECVMSNIEFE